MPAALSPAPPTISPLSATTGPSSERCRPTASTTSLAVNGSASPASPPSRPRAPPPASVQRCGRTWVSSRLQAARGRGGAALAGLASLDMPQRSGHGEEDAEVVRRVVLADLASVRLDPCVGAERRHPPCADAPGRPLAAQPAEQDGGQRPWHAPLPRRAG